jgi:membrane associated rhomboid family serine protease
MLIPYNTDAPVYHLPIATVALIAINVVCFAITGAGSSSNEIWVLSYNDGLHPMQWVCSLFFHTGWVHLVGNMLFLWVFGLVVEGKIGWKSFLIVYFGTGLAQNLFEQLAMQWIPTNAAGSAGASGVIFGLMAIATVWAPKNEIQCYLFAFIRIFDFEIAIVTMAVCYIVLNVMIAVLNRFAVSSEILHLIGATLGFVVGAKMLQRGWVDCESWDLFSLWRGKHKATPEVGTQRHMQPAAAVKMLTESGSFNFTAKAKQRYARIGELISNKKFTSALRELQQLKHLIPDQQLSEQELGDLVRGLYSLKRWEDVRPLIREFIDRFPDRANSMRLRLTAILLEVEKRPRAALRQADQIDANQLRSRQVRELKKILRAARKLVDSGHLEVDR